MKNIIISLSFLLISIMSIKAQGLQLGTRASNMGRLIYNGQLLTCSRDALAQKVHLYLAQPADSRLLIMQNTQTGTVSVFGRETTGTWVIVATNTLGMLPTITCNSPNKYRIYWDDVYDVTVTFK